MNSQTIKFNKTQKLLFKNKIRIVKLHKKSNSPSLFSRSLYLTRFINMSKLRNVPDSAKCLNRTSLFVPKYINLMNAKNNKLNNKNNTRYNKIKNLNIVGINNTPKIIKQNLNKTNPNSQLDKEEESKHKLLYENNIKLKTKINKLKLELFFAKSLSRKKDEEISELNKHLEEAKLSSGKPDKQIYIEKVKYENKIMKLKNTFENLVEKIREKTNANNSLLKQTKRIDINELINKIDEQTKILKAQYEILKSKNKINFDTQLKLNKSSWKKYKYLENDKFLNRLKSEFNKKLLKVEYLYVYVYRLREKCEKINSQKNQILRHNYSIKNDNMRLLGDKKDRQDYIMKKADIEKKILIYQRKAQDLTFQSKENESYIYTFLNQKDNKENKNDNFKYKTYLEPNPNENKGKQVILYESLIEESKKRQKELVKYIYNLINNKNNVNNIENNSKIFDKDININSDINFENIDEKNNDKKDFQFLLNVMFYIKNITKEKIENILLDFKTENYYIGNLEEKDNFISELASEILEKINNKKDINNLKEILTYLYETKYKNNKIIFLAKVLNDIYILDNTNIILFNIEQENILFQKLENIYLDKINSLIEKIKNIKEENISYAQLKKIFKEEDLYIEEHEEKKKLFQFFIYILKKREYTFNQDYLLNEFSIKDILEFLNDLSSKEEEDKILINEFFKALKNMLDDKKMDFKKLIGKNKNTNITDFINILNENNFVIEIDNFDLYSFLQKFKTSENSDNINIELIQNYLNEI